MCVHMYINTKVYEKLMQSSQLGENARLHFGTSNQMFLVEEDESDLLWAEPPLFQFYVLLTFFINFIECHLYMSYKYCMLTN
jgi:hypothetical protein